MFKVLDLCLKSAILYYSFPVTNNVELPLIFLFQVFILIRQLGFPVCQVLRLDGNNEREIV